MKPRCVSIEVAENDETRITLAGFGEDILAMWVQLSVNIADEVGINKAVMLIALASVSEELAKKASEGTTYDFSQLVKNE